MTPEQFNSLRLQGYNRVPVSLEVLADFDTPLSTYLKLADQPYTYLLESVQGGEKWGRYSIIGLPCRQFLRVRGNQVEEVRLAESGSEEVISCATVEDPLEYISNYQKQFNVAERADLPRFNGGLVGFFGYDCVGYIEPRISSVGQPDELNTDDILLMISDEFVIFDNLSGKIIFIVHTDPAVEGSLQKANSRLSQLSQLLRSTPLPDLSKIPATPVTESDFKSGYGQDKFQQDVERLREYVFAGDVMQTVLSQRLSANYDAPPINLYRALRSLNPSPYMYYVNLPDYQIVGSSPEILARLENNEVTIRPIAGTRYRGKTAEEDLALELELLADPKEIAEHLMLIDLGRNDCGRVSQTGTVKVTDQMAVERYSHVMHIVSNVTGKLAEGLGAMDVLRAAHPAGTLSGAPKIRAMEILQEMEPCKRGVYGGAVGYISFSGNMDLAIAIRTAVIKDGKVYVQAGAGVVADSQPRLEWKETMNKARALFKATELATTGLQ